MTTTAPATTGSKDFDARRIPLDSGISLSVSARGDGPPVLLLPGFPQNAYVWRNHLSSLAAAGFRAIAPDMRGYGASDRPAAVSDYARKHLVADIAGLVRALGYDKVHLVGHDWGAIVAFYVATARPELVDRLVILNGPHPDGYFRALLRGDGQRRRAWYVFLFQLPFLPERVLARKGVLERMFRKYGPGVLSEEEISVYARAVREPGAARAMINYYRAAARQLKPIGKVKQPTLVLWGEDDLALGTTLLDDFHRDVKNLTVRRFPGVSHWIVEERPQEVNDEIVKFLRAG